MSADKLTISLTKEEIEKIYLEELYNARRSCLESRTNHENSFTKIILTISSAALTVIILLISKSNYNTWSMWSAGFFIGCILVSVLDKMLAVQCLTIMADLRNEMIRPFIQIIGTVTEEKIDIKKLKKQEKNYGWICSKLDIIIVSLFAAGLISLGVSVFTTSPPKSANKPPIQCVIKKTIPVQTNNASKPGT